METQSKWNIMQMMPRLKWSRNDFCHEHIIRTFADDNVPICSGQDDSIQCSGARHSENMATCSFRGLSMRPKEMIGAFRSDEDKGAMNDFTMNLIGRGSCPRGNVKQLEKRTSAPIPTKLVKHIIDAPRTEDSECDKWIEKPALLHVSNAVHIYFKFLDLYNVHKAAFDEGLHDNEYVVVRIGNLANDRLDYMHAEFEEKLFGMSDVRLIDLAKEGVGTVCFKNAVMVPNAYASVPFRCKMESSTRKKCIECAGPKDVEHPMVTFSQRVRRTCGLHTEQSTAETNTTIVTLISRKPYTRWKGDAADKNFHRVLENEDELVSALESASKNLNFQFDVVRLESMAICEQVTKSASSDILIGVHGAGLVHLWWLAKEHSTVIELEPTTQATNPSFRKGGRVRKGHLIKRNNKFSHLGLWRHCLVKNMSRSERRGEGQRLARSQLGSAPTPSLMK